MKPARHAVGRSRHVARTSEPRDLTPLIAAARMEGAASLRQIAAALNARGIPAARGGVWLALQVRRLLD